MAKTRNKAIPAAYLFLERDDKFLIARRCNTGYQDGLYHVPAGHVEDQELPSRAIVREAKEEICIDIDPADLQLFHVSYRPRHDATDNRVDFFFRTRIWKGDVVNAEPDKCDDLKWVSLDELPRHMTLHIQEAFDALKTGLLYKEITIEDLKDDGLYSL